MKRTLLIATALAGLTMGAAVGVPAFAKDGDSGGRSERPSLSANQIVDRADARIARFKADLNLNADQAKNWDGLQTALHDIAARRAERWVAMRDKLNQERDKLRAAADAPRDQAKPATPNAPAAGSSASTTDEARRGPDTIDRLRRMADEMTQRADDARKIADAAQPLYTTLDDKQRRRFAHFIRESAEADREMSERMVQDMRGLRRERRWEREREREHDRRD